MNRFVWWIAIVLLVPNFLLFGGCKSTAFQKTRENLGEKAEEKQAPQNKKEQEPAPVKPPKDIKPVLGDKQPTKLATKEEPTKVDPPAGVVKTDYTPQTSPLIENLKKEFNRLETQLKETKADRDEKAKQLQLQNAEVTRLQGELQKMTESRDKFQKLHQDLARVMDDLTGPDVSGLLRTLASTKGYWEKLKSKDPLLVLDPKPLEIIDGLQDKLFRSKEEQAQLQREVAKEKAFGEAKEKEIVELKKERDEKDRKVQVQNAKIVEISSDSLKWKEGKDALQKNFDELTKQLANVKVELPSTATSSEWTFWHWLWIVIGSALLLAVISFLVKIARKKKANPAGAGT